MTSLQQEVETCHRLLPSLLAQEGRFALIEGSERVGTFDAHQDALASGCEKFRLESFLVKQVSAIPQVAHFTRDLGRCPA